jgi:enoyl-CoA hydratase
MGFEQIAVELHAGVATLRLASGKLNAITPVLLREAREALAGIGRDPDAKSVILTGGDSRFFSFGLDVARLLPLERKDMAAVLRDLNAVLRTLFFFPKPVVAAVNGHAVAGGLLLAVTADYRIGAEGPFSIGLSEVNLGLAAPAVSLRIMAHQIGEARTREAALTGTIYDPAAAARLGLFHEVAPPDRLQHRAREKASQLGGLPPGGVALNKHYLAADIPHVDPAREAAEDEAWLDAWFSPEAQNHLQALVERG